MFKLRLPTGAFRIRPSWIITYLGVPFKIDRAGETSVVVWTDQWLAVTYLKGEEDLVMNYE